MYARAIRIAAVVASEPVFKKMLSSAEGTRSLSFFASCVLIGLGESEAKSLVLYLPEYGVIDLILPVSQDDRPVAAQVIDELIPVDIDRDGTLCRIPERWGIRP